MSELDPYTLDPNEHDDVNRIVEIITSSLSLVPGGGIVSTLIRTMLGKVLDLQQKRLILFTKALHKEFITHKSDIVTKFERLNNRQLGIIRLGLKGSSEIPNDENIIDLAKIVYNGINDDESLDSHYTYCLTILASLNKAEIKTLCYISLDSGSYSLHERTILSDAINSYRLDYPTNPLYSTITTNLLSKGLIVPDKPFKLERDIEKSANYLFSMYNGTIRFQPSPIGLFIAYCICSELRDHANERIKYVIDEFKKSSM